MARKLYRNPNGKFMGLCSGLAEYIGMDTGILRLLFIISIFMTGGVSLLVYIVAGIFIPIKDGYGYRDTIFDDMSERNHRKRNVNVSDVKREFDNLKSRVSNMEDNVFNKEKEWDERFKNS